MSYSEIVKYLMSYSEIVKYLMSYSEIAKNLIGIGGIIVAIWQARKHYNLKKFIIYESIEEYLDTDMLRSHVQTCLKSLQNGNTAVGIQEAGKVEGMANSLFTRSIKNIHRHSNYKRKDIDTWVNNKKIPESHKDDFLRYADK